MGTITASRSADAIVIGGNLTGLFAALLLRNLGFRTLVLEASDSWGGWDRSVMTGWGARFDMGFHVVDHERSLLVTRLVADLLGDDLGVHTLERNIALAGTTFPYAAPPAQWPEGLRPLLDGCREVDDIDDGAVTVAALRRVYGEAFVRHVVDEVVASYPTLVAQRDQGVPVDQLLLNIYPWYFPNVERTGARVGESSRYHEAMRRHRDQRVIYPRRDGFVAVTNAMLQRLTAAGVETRKGVGPVSLVPSATGAGVDALLVAGERLDAHLYCWSAGLVPIFKQLGVPMPRAIPVEFLIGSFELRADLGHTPHEILVGDPRLSINRMSFPARLVDGQPNTLVQVEYAVPRRSASVTDEEWTARWSSDLARLGLLSPDNAVRGAEVMRLPLGECLPGEEAPAVAPVLERYDAEDSNFCLLSRSITPRNVNQALPSTAAQVTAFAAR